MGRCRSWTDEQLETAGVLALIYGKVTSRNDTDFSDWSDIITVLKFIEVWRQKENAVKSTQLASLLLTNASHEGSFALDVILSRCFTNPSPVAFQCEHPSIKLLGSSNWLLNQISTTIRVTIWHMHTRHRR